MLFSSTLRTQSSVLPVLTTTLSAGYCSRSARSSGGSRCRQAAVAPVPSRTRPATALAWSASASIAFSTAASMCCACRSSSLPAGVGPRAPAHALHQPHREAALELAHLQAHRGLAQAQALGRGREAAGLDHQPEGAQLVEIEQRCSGLSKVFLMACIGDRSFIYRTPRVKIAPGPLPTFPLLSPRSRSPTPSPIT